MDDGSSVKPESPVRTYLDASFKSCAGGLFPLEF